MNKKNKSSLKQQLLRLLTKKSSGNSIGIRGRYRYSIKKKDGTIEKENWITNTIGEDLKSVINGNFSNSVDRALNNLFTAQAKPPTTGKDGIILKETAGDWSSMITTFGTTSGTSTKFTGTYVAGGAITFTDAKLGFNWGAGDFQVPYATPTSWTSKTLANGETLTVEWEITVG